MLSSLSYIIYINLHGLTHFVYLMQLFILSKELFFFWMSHRSYQLFFTRKYKVSNEIHHKSTWKKHCSTRRLVKIIDNSICPLIILLFLAIVVPIGTESFLFLKSKFNLILKEMSFIEDYNSLWILVDISRIQNASSQKIFLFNNV